MQRLFIYCKFIYFIFFVKYQFSWFFFFIIKPRNTYVTRDDMSKYQQSRNKISTKISLSVYPRKLTGLHNNSKAKAVLQSFEFDIYVFITYSHNFVFYSCVYEHGCLTDNNCLDCDSCIAVFLCSK
jgi:hypothetical protein